MIQKIKADYPVEIRTTPYGNGLFATKQIKADEVVLTVNRQYFLVYDDLINKFPGTVVKDKRAEFAYRLACELVNIENSPYKEYLLTLPKINCTPICLEINEFAQFQNKNFVQRMINKCQQVREAYEIIYVFAKQKDYPLVTLKLFLYCYSLIQSRTLYFPTLLDPTSEVGAMIPFYDMCNHSEEVNRKNIFKLFYFDKEHNAYILKAYKNYEENEQVFISYGSYNNQHFVEYYGFIPEGNPNNLDIELKIDFSKDKDSTKKLELVEMTFPHKLNTYPRTLLNPLPLSINQEGQIIDGDLLWIICLTQESLKRFNKKQLFGRLQNSPFAKLCDLPKYKSVINKLVREALDQYSTALDEDLELKQQNSTFCLPLQFRITENQQILKILKLLP